MFLVHSFSYVLLRLKVYLANTLQHLRSTGCATSTTCAAAWWCSGFNDMGLTCFEPRGAFYAFPCIKSTGMSSQEFCTKLLEQKHVAIIPGDAFGASGEGYCRVSYAYSVEHLTEALKRIREFLEENGIYHGN